MSNQSAFGQSDLEQSSLAQPNHREEYAEQLPYTPTSATPVPQFDAFVQTIARLRDVGGCPWDQAQTNQSIAKHIIEEAYEAVDAIEREDYEHAQEELGDLLEQVVLQSQIAADHGYFSIHDVVQGIDDKIIRRHPHVFGDLTAASPEEVASVWEDVKREERAQKAARAQAQGKDFVGLLDDVPRSLPALSRAQKISHKMVNAGFEWQALEDVFDQLEQEIDEYKQAVCARDKAVSTHDQTASNDDKVARIQGGTDDPSEAAVLEFGDLLFTLVNIGRKQGIDAEAALRKATAKIQARWEYMEKIAHQNGKNLKYCSMDELEKLWACAKDNEIKL